MDDNISIASGRIDTDRYNGLFEHSLLSDREDIDLTRELNLIEKRCNKIRHNISSWRDPFIEQLYYVDIKKEVFIIKIMLAKLDEHTRHGLIKRKRKSNWIYLIIFIISFLIGIELIKVLF